MITSLQNIRSEETSGASTSRATCSKDRLLELRNNIYNLQVRNRSLCDKYKNNLKHAFQTKIRTYRLEALFNRRNQKYRREADKALRQKLLEQEKRKKVKQIKMQRMSSRLYVQEVLQQRAEKARSMSIYEHSLNQKRIIDIQNQERLRKRNMRNALIGSRLETKKQKEDRQNTSLKRQRQSYVMQIRTQLEQILMKEEMLEKLKDQLRTLQPASQEKYWS